MACSRRVQQKVRGGKRQNMKGAFLGEMSRPAPADSLGFALLGAHVRKFNKKCTKLPVFFFFCTEWL